MDGGFVVEKGGLIALQCGCGGWGWWSFPVVIFWGGGWLFVIAGSCGGAERIVEGL